MTKRPALSDTQVTIVGLGLMGGSMAAALMSSHACRRVVGVARRDETIAQALTMGIIHEGTCDLAVGVRSADIVVLATPVRAIVGLVRELGPLLMPGCLLTDLGSTKQEVVRAMQALPKHVQAVGGHPMCGRESSGLSAAESSLYEGATFVLTPLPRTNDAAIALASDLADAIGARPLLLEPSRHDMLVAAISHLPYLLAVGLVHTAESVGDDDLWRIVASGFRDTSRLAASNETMMCDVLLTNRTLVRQMLTRCQHQLEDLAQLLDTGDDATLRSALITAAQRRRGLFR